MRARRRPRYAGRVSEAGEHRVLYLDPVAVDRSGFTNAVHRAIDVVAVDSSEAAHAELAQGRYPVIVAAHGGKGIDAIEFFSKVSEKDPDAFRIVVSSESEFADVVRAINEGSVHRFIPRPWRAQELIGIIQNASTRYWTHQQNEKLFGELLHKVRLAAIGEVTRGLAEEIDTVLDELSPVLSIDVGDRDAGLRILKEAQTAIRRFTYLMETLRIYSKSGDRRPLEMKLVDLRDVAEKVISVFKLLARQKGDGITLQVPESEILVSADPRRLEQALYVLLQASVTKLCAGVDRVRGEMAIAVEDDAVRLSVGRGTGSPTGEQRAPGAPVGSLGFRAQVASEILVAHGGRVWQQGDGADYVLTAELPRHAAT